MTFIRTVPPEEASGTLASLYRHDLDSSGFVPNHTRALSLRPEAVAAFRDLTRAIKQHMPARRFELVTLAAARALRSSYCMLTHGSTLGRQEGWDAATLAEVVRDRHAAALEPVEVALMDFAEKLTREAGAITLQDVDGLRSLGLKDEDILDVALTAALRNFYSKLLDAVGAQADARYAELDAGLLDALVLGRPIQEAV